MIDLVVDLFFRVAVDAGVAAVRGVVDIVTKRTERASQLDDLLRTRPCGDVARGIAEARYRAWAISRGFATSSRARIAGDVGGHTLAIDVGLAGDGARAVEATVAIALAGETPRILRACASDEARDHWLARLFEDEQLEHLRTIAISRTSIRLRFVPLCPPETIGHALDELVALFPRAAASPYRSAAR